MWLAWLVQSPKGLSSFSLLLDICSFFHDLYWKMKTQLSWSWNRIIFFFFSVKPEPAQPSFPLLYLPWVLTFSAPCLHRWRQHVQLKNKKHTTASPNVQHIQVASSCWPLSLLSIGLNSRFQLLNFRLLEGHEALEPLKDLSHLSTLLHFNACLSFVPFHALGC